MFLGLRGMFGGGGGEGGRSKVASVEQILPQQRLKTSKVSYVSVVCGKEW